MRLSSFLACLLLPACLFGGGKFFYIGDADVRVIKENWRGYESAAAKTGVPILALIAIHHRESNLRKGHYSKKLKRVVRNVGGPFMLDFGPRNNPTEFAKRIRIYERKMSSLYALGHVPRVSSDFSFAALCAAHHLKEKSRGDLSRTAVLADALWGYNGRATWNGGFKHSAYVWSDPMNGGKFKFKYRNSSGKLIEFVDQRPGAMVLYLELKALEKKGVIP